ncbi:MAG: DNA repair protein RecO, partial [Clostridia bacterium]|nr:DNA repair protein RecO [Clostridia bacterium]
MEFKTDALLLRATDYGESDKIVTLLTADRGKLTASVKGVKKAAAKLRFAAQPFCFAEYVLAARGERNTVVSASLYDGFYSLREDLPAYFSAACVTEACDRLSYEDTESGEFLVAAVTALREMGGGDPAFALVKFLLRALALAGYPVTAEHCAVCGKPLAGRMCFDFSGGAFTCSECGVGVAASESTYFTIRAALGAGGE